MVRKSTTKSIVLWSVPALFAALAFAACDDDSPTDQTGEATLEVFLTDAPGDVDSVWVQVDDVILIGSGGQTSLLDEPTDLINLTTLQETAEAVSGDVEIEPGTYTEVRLVLGGAVLQAKGENVYAYGDVEHPGGLEITGDLLCPSCSQSGLKIKVPGGVEVEDGDNLGLLVDFDVSQSFGHPAGQSGMWVMHPVILGTVADPDDIEGNATAGEITGTVVLDEGVAIPMCGEAERTLEEFVPLAETTTLTDDVGTTLIFSGVTSTAVEPAGFSIEVLGVDTYNLGYVTESVFGDEKLVWTATVDPTTAEIAEAGDLVQDVAYTVTSVECENTEPI